MMETARTRDGIVKRIRKAFEVAGLALILASTIHSPSTAANLRVDPSISLEERWDSNIFSASSGEISDFVFRAKPTLTAFITAFQTTTKISGGFEFERYADNGELDDETAAVDLRLSSLEPLRLTPRFSLRPSATLVETRDAARRNRLFTTTDGTPEIVPFETVVTERIRSRDYGVSLTLNYLVGPRTDFSLGGAWSRREFFGDVVGLDAENSQTVSGDTALAYRVTPRFSSGVFVRAGRNTFERSPTARTYSAGLTGAYAITEQYSVNARAGVSYLEEDADATGRENTESSPSGSLSLTYSLQTFQATLRGSYDLSGGGSFGETTRRGTVGLILTNQFAARWEGDLSVHYQTNRSAGDQMTLDIDTVQGAAGVRYTAAKWASFRLSGDILRQRSAGLEGDDIDRESIVLGVDLTTSYVLF